VVGIEMLISSRRALSQAREDTPWTACRFRYYHPDLARQARMGVESDGIQGPLEADEGLQSLCDIKSSPTKGSSLS
jgi:hypothetical protein